MKRDSSDAPMQEKPAKKRVEEEPNAGYGLSILCRTGKLQPGLTMF
jgi:hypothetical protein